MVGGGERGIRTLGTGISRTHAFQACTFNRSVISPLFRSVAFKCLQLTSVHRSGAANCIPNRPAPYTRFWLRPLALNLKASLRRNAAPACALERCQVCTFNRSVISPLLPL